MKKMLCMIALLGLLTDSATTTAQQRGTRQKTSKSRKHTSRSGSTMTDSMGRMNDTVDRMNGTMQDDGSVDTMRRTRRNRR